MVASGQAKAGRLPWHTHAVQVGDTLTGPETRVGIGFQRDVPIFNRTLLGPTASSADQAGPIS